MNANIARTGMEDLYNRIVTGALSLAIVGMAGLLTFTQVMTIA